MVQTCSLLDVHPILNSCRKPFGSITRAIAPCLCSLVERLKYRGEDSNGLVMRCLSDLCDETDYNTAEDFVFVPVCTVVA